MRRRDIQKILHNEKVRYTENASPIYKSCLYPIRMKSDVALTSNMYIMITIASDIFALGFLPTFNLLAIC